MKKTILILALFILIFQFQNSLFSLTYKDVYPAPKNYILPGINLSYSDGFQLGGDLSYAYYDDEWIGFYTDFLYNSKNENLKWSLGPEFGWYVFGVDFGFLLKKRNQDLKPGINSRILLSFVLAHLYLRLDYIPKEEKSFEFGLILKLPLAVR